ncbi:SsrA-binding protein [Flavobacterium sp. 7A]|nr:SsrA-binding protein [Flavobacterium sp. 7A]MCW2120788.1 hypothetical protein [Flavobacterium sp. 7A]
MFRILAYLNKLLLPSFTKRKLDLSKAKNWQLALLGYKYYVTSRVINQ